MGLADLLISCNLCVYTVYYNKKCRLYRKPYFDQEFSIKFNRRDLHVQTKYDIVCYMIHSECTNASSEPIT